MKYQLPKRDVPKKDFVTSVMFRVPHDLIDEFNEVLKHTDISAQKLIESMVRHCLEDIKTPLDPKFPRTPLVTSGGTTVTSTSSPYNSVITNTGEKDPRFVVDFGTIDGKVGL